MDDRSLTAELEKWAWTCECGRRCPMCAETVRGNMRGVPTLVQDLTPGDRFTMFPTSDKYRYTVLTIGPDDHEAEHYRLTLGGEIPEAFSEGNEGRTALFPGDTVVFKQLTFGPDRL